MLQAVKVSMTISIYCRAANNSNSPEDMQVSIEQIQIQIYYYYYYFHVISIKFISWISFTSLYVAGKTGVSLCQCTSLIFILMLKVYVK
jgi:uncharacterized membrane protein YjjP (DUF1212 family)